MRFVRLYTGEDGQSHLEEMDAPMALVEQAPFEPVTGVSFRRYPPGHVWDWHNAPRRQYVITLAGQAEIVLGDGTVMSVSPGDVLLAEDLTEKGHIIRAVGGEYRVSVAIAVA
ncbi:MAG: hypothetical protein QGH66_05510 [Dehalococcoidia bacterium]|jgi:quercetin dioxygenase-like cupin family protein|nr:hypothetical protein [Dehalococcoidia bacterium]MDP7239843.1 hypothetical protein [Dehalococcoidia bacterium]MDP7470628.1 hypothetical protein [Dehalococcoidia bacterium]